VFLGLLGPLVWFLGGLVVRSTRLVTRSLVQWHQCGATRGGTHESTTTSSRPREVGYLERWVITSEWAFVNQPAPAWPSTSWSRRPQPLTVASHAVCPAPAPRAPSRPGAGARGRARRDGGAAASAVGGDGYGAEADHDSREPAQAAEHGVESDNPQDDPRRPGKTGSDGLGASRCGRGGTSRDRRGVGVPVSPSARGSGRFAPEVVRVATPGGRDGPLVS
jgi:hypothetical protein